MSKSISFFMCSLLMLVAFGCSPYVNIPGQPGDTLASNNPNNGTAQEVIIAAIQAANQQRPMQGTYQVVLPQGTQPKTYAIVLPQLGANAFWSSSGVAGDAPVIEVRGVRVRGTSADVDLLRPSTKSVNQNRELELVTVSLSNYIPAGWGATRIRIWRGDVDQALLLSQGQPVDSELMPNEEITPGAE